MHHSASVEIQVSPNGPGQDPLRRRRRARRGEHHERRPLCSRHFLTLRTRSGSDLVTRGTGRPWQGLAAREELRPRLVSQLSVAKGCQKTVEHRVPHLHRSWRITRLQRLT
jgi:hypothetical protein